MSQIIKMLQAEIIAVRDDISARPDPRYAKLDGLLALLRLYDQDAAIQADAISPHDMALRESDRDRAVADSPGSRAFRSKLREAAVERAMAYLQARGGSEPVKTAEIYANIKDDVQIGGKEPISNLSAVMNQSGAFVSHGRRGWTLPNNAPAPRTGWTPVALFEEQKEDKAL